MAAESGAITGTYSTTAFVVDYSFVGIAAGNLANSLFYHIFNAADRNGRSGPQPFIGGREQVSRFLL